MPHLPPVQRPRIPGRGMPAGPFARHLRAFGSIALGALLLLGLVPVASPVAAADGLAMQGHALVQGHVRTGAWFAIAIDVSNDGPTITGELRIVGGADTRTRFGTAVELATGSRKRYLLYAQPPTFGGNVTVALVSGGGTLAQVQVAIALHDATQLVVGVVAENPARLVGQLDLLPSQFGAQSVIVPMDPEDLPERVEAWGVLDRLVWQDVDTARLAAPQLAALRGWIAGGGRLVVAGGTAGPDILTALPDDLLPYRPTGLLDVDPERLRGLLGGLPDGAATLPAMAGELTRGRALATSGDRAIAADAPHGGGSVTILGIDPTVSWLAEGEAYDAPLWRRLLPARSSGGGSLADDSQLVSAVSNLPSLALPPIGGLIVLLLGYIVLVGPVNYVVLRRLDRREWAWVTVPALIVVFTVGAFGFGASIRGSDVIVHEVAIVRGAAGTADALAQSYLGVFSPTRAVFQLRVPGGALLASPINGDFFGGDGGGVLDVLQGDPSRVRDMAVGFGSLRTVRAEAATAGPIVDGDLRLEDGRLKGTITNRSDRVLIAPAVVLGSSAAVLPDIAAGGRATVDMQVLSNPFNQSQLSERIVGQVFFPGDGSSFDSEAQRKLVRRSIIDQLSYDPMTGFQASLNADNPVLLAWGTDPVVPLEIDGERLRRVANVLYDIPLSLAISGRTTFQGDLLRTSVLEVDTAFFNKDPWTISFGPGSVRMSFRPIPFQGTFAATEILLSMNFGGDLSIPGARPEPLVEAARCEPGTEGCAPFQDGLPDIEVLDRRSGAWVQFAHMSQGRAYELTDASRWVDPATGELQARFVNEHSDGVGFQLAVQLTGDVR